MLIHSGRQFGGELINSGKHEQEGEPLASLQMEFGPQGEGWHKLIGGSGGSSKIHYFSKHKNLSGCNNALRIGKHLMNGSPVNLLGQLQIGLWFTTSHLAAIPHVPGQGSIHFWLTHASFKGHSELVTHSGLQVGGLPIKPGTHEHTACPFICLQRLLGPQGDGLHGFLTTRAKRGFLVNAVAFVSIRDLL